MPICSTEDHLSKDAGFSANAHSQSKPAFPSCSHHLDSACQAPWIHPDDPRAEIERPSEHRRAQRIYLP